MAKTGTAKAAKDGKVAKAPSNSFRAAAAGGTEDLRQACTGMVGESGDLASMLEIIESDFAPFWNR